jgi:hypothetical protein
MEDLSGIKLPGKMTVSGAFALMPQSDMDSLSDRSHTDAAAQLMGIGETKEVPDGRSE